MRSDCSQRFWTIYHCFKSCFGPETIMMFVSGHYDRFHAWFKRMALNLSIICAFLVRVRSISCLVWLECHIIWAAASQQWKNGILKIQLHLTCKTVCCNWNVLMLITQNAVSNKQNKKWNKVTYTTHRQTKKTKDKSQKKHKGEKIQ